MDEALDPGAETPPEGDDDFADTGDEKDEGDEEASLSGDEDEVMVLLDEEDEEHGEGEEHGEEEDHGEEHGEGDRGEEEREQQRLFEVSVVPPELEAAALLPGASREAHAALLCALRHCLTLVEEESGLRAQLAVAWTRQMTAMALTTPEWLAWARDDDCSWKDRREKLRRAVDAKPVSVQLRLELARAAYGDGDDEAVERMRGVLAEGVKTAGCDVQGGRRVWEAAIALETDLGEQTKVFDLQKAMLATPLKGSEKAMLDFNKQQYTKEQKRKVAAAHTAALKKRKAVEGQETAVARATLAIAEDPAGCCEAWLQYSASEQLAPRRRVVLERALVAFESQAASKEKERLWLALRDHALFTLKDFPLALSVCERAVRDLPLSLPLRLALCRAKERLGQDPEWPAVFEAFNPAALCRAYSEFERRRGADGAQVLMYLRSLTTVDYELERFWASEAYERAVAGVVDVEKCAAGRAAWRALLDNSASSSLHHRLKVHRHAATSAWLARDMAEARRLHRAAATIAQTQRRTEPAAAKTAAEAWLNFEAQVGSLADFDVAESKTRSWLAPEIKKQQREEVPKMEQPALKKARTTNIVPAAPAPAPARAPAAAPAAAPAPAPAAAPPAAAPAAPAPTVPASSKVAPPAAGGGEEGEEKKKKKKKKKRKEPSTPEEEELWRTAFVTETAKLDESSLRSHFETAVGGVTTARVIRDKRTAEHKGSAFLVFASRDQLVAALKLSPEQRTVGGQVVKVNASKYQAPPPFEHKPWPTEAPKEAENKKQPLVPRVLRRPAAASTTTAPPLKKKKLDVASSSSTKNDDAPIEPTTTTATTAPTATTATTAPAELESPPETAPSSSSLSNDAFRAFLT